jgi:glycosyltransferase involved in cell wall biosynthesis
MSKISVIMGIYNSNKRDMVSLSINSVLEQSFADFEFIICDDGSTDGTYQLISELA